MFVLEDQSVNGYTELPQTILFNNTANLSKTKDNKIAVLDPLQVMFNERKRVGFKCEH